MVLIFISKKKKKQFIEKVFAESIRTLLKNGSYFVYFKDMIMFYLRFCIFQKVYSNIIEWEINKKQ